MRPIVLLLSGMKPLKHRSVEDLWLIHAFQGEEKFQLRPAVLAPSLILSCTSTTFIAFIIFYVMTDNLFNVFQASSRAHKPVKG